MSQITQNLEFVKFMSVTHYKQIIWVSLKYNNFVSYESNLSILERDHDIIDIYRISRFKDFNICNKQNLKIYIF